MTNSRTSGPSLLVALLMLIASSQQGKAEDWPFPLVITRAADLDRLGISLPDKGAGSDVTYPNNCYYYGDGGYGLAMSKEFLARFKARGFSRRSLCMAIVSGIRFDPESGRRLPTFISADVKRLKEQGKYAEAGVLTEELPLDVPDCFKGGLPYSDCDMNYDLMTGKRLSPKERERWREIGLKIEQALASREVRDNFRYLEDSRGPGATIYVGFQWGLAGEPSVSFWDYAEVFPKGFGYALFADGAAGPSPSDSAVKIALEDRQRSTRAKLKKAEELLRKEK